MQMWTGGISGTARQPNNIALVHGLTTTHVPLREMCVKSLPTITVVNDYHVTIAPIAPTREHNYAAIGGVYGYTMTGGNVNATVVGAVTEARKVAIGGWPDETT
jgi:hypothetical protein